MSVSFMMAHSSGQEDERRIDRSRKNNEWQGRYDWPESLGSFENDDIIPRQPQFFLPPQQTRFWSDYIRRSNRTTSMDFFKVVRDVFFRDIQSTTIENRISRAREGRTSERRTKHPSTALPPFADICALWKLISSDSCVDILGINEIRFE